jgi:hypothetical protein
VQESDTELGISIDSRVGIGGGFGVAQAVNARSPGSNDRLHSSIVAKRLPDRLCFTGNLLGDRALALGEPIDADSNAARHLGLQLRAGGFLFGYDDLRPGVVHLFLRKTSPGVDAPQHDDRNGRDDQPAVQWAPALA